jgi:hypothetical protein
MKTTRFNWPVWTAFLLSVFAVFSYPTIFVRWPSTRDFPWVNLLLFAIAGVLLLFGIRRALAPERRLRSKIVNSVVATFSVLLIGLFIFGFFVASRWIPASHGAPQVGQQAPEFNLKDTSGKSVTLTQLRTEPIDGKAPKGVLLIFYRGYW